MALHEVLGRSFQEHSVLWLLLSGVIGGIVGAAVKFGFESVLGPGYARWSENRAALRRHSDPLPRAAESLGHRLDNMLRHAGKGWFEESQYYRLSTLYLVGSCYGVARILEREAYLEYAVSTRHGRRLWMAFQGIFSGLSSWDPFEEVPRDEISHKDIAEATTLRHALTAIGELMTRATPDGRVEVIGFVEFVEKYETDSECRRWFAFVERPLERLRKDVNDARWNRIVVFATMIHILVRRLDPKGRRTEARPFAHLATAHPKVQDYLHKRIRACGLSPEAVAPRPAGGTAR